MSIRVLVRVVSGPSTHQRGKSAMMPLFSSFYLGPSTHQRGYRFTALFSCLLIATYERPKGRVLVHIFFCAYNEIYESIFLFIYLLPM